MKERPILFSGEMVRAILDGRKTQTRRVARIPRGYEEWTPEAGSDGTLVLRGQGISTWVDCPYGVPGDRLWARETWRERGTTGIHIAGEQDAEWLEYRADGDVDGPSWRPSIHMPKWASRITLEVTGVRVERVQDISEEDAIAEGIQVEDRSFGRAWRNYDSRMPSEWFTHHTASFWSLWDSINAKRGYSWESNPPVWVVEFRRVTP